MKKREFPPVLPKGRPVCFRQAMRDAKQNAATLAEAKRKADAILRKKGND